MITLAEASTVVGFECVLQSTPVDFRSAFFSGESNDSLAGGSSRHQFATFANDENEALKCLENGQGNEVQRTSVPCSRLSLSDASHSGLASNCRSLLALLKWNRKRKTGHHGLHLAPSMTKLRPETCEGRVGFSFETRRPSGAGCRRLPLQHRL